MPGRKHKTPVILQETYGSIKRELLRKLPEIDGLILNQRDGDGKLKILPAKMLRKGLLKMVGSLKETRVELEEALDDEIATLDEGDELDEKVSVAQEFTKSHTEFLQQKVEDKIDDLEVLIEEFQQFLNEEKEDQARKDESAERDRIAVQNRVAEEAQQKQIRDEKRQYEVEDTERQLKAQVEAEARLRKATVEDVDRMLL